MTDLAEKTSSGKPKCERYWPDTVGSVVNYGQTEVKLTASSNVPGGNGKIKLRQLQVTANGQARQVQQVQCTFWADGTVPPMAQFGLLLETVRTARLQTSGAAPVAIHCSAGIGRTGVFVLSEILKTKVEDGLVPDVLEILGILRRQRCALIQTPGQLEFCYDVAIAAAERRLTTQGGSSTPGGGARRGGAAAAPPPRMQLPGTPDNQQHIDL